MLVLIFNMLVTTLLCGMSWYTQTVHYPLFLHLKKIKMPTFYVDDQKRNLMIYAPLMLIEILTTFAVFFFTDAKMLAGMALLSNAGIIVAVIAFQFPVYRQLMFGFDGPSIKELIYYNWIKTFFWSVKTLIAAALIVVA